MLGHLEPIDETLAQQVRDGLGVESDAMESIAAAREPIDLKESPALRIYGKYKDTFAGRKVGLLFGAGFDAERRKALVAAITKEKAKVAIVASKIQGEIDGEGTLHPADVALRAAPSVLFDAVAVLAGPDGDKTLAQNPDAVPFLMDADRHCKAVAWGGVPTLSGKAGVKESAGLVQLDDKADVRDFVDAARAGRFWRAGSTARSAVRAVRPEVVRAKGRRVPWRGN
jgi:catalase